MTEIEWRECDDPQRMLDALPPAAASGRKLRLFAVACAARVGELMGDARSRQAVATAARFVEGQASEGELGAAVLAALAACGDVHAAGFGSGAADGAGAAAARASYASAGAAAAAAKAQDFGCPLCAASHAAYYAAWAAREATWAGERAAQAGLLRDLFGDAARPVAVSPSWLRWNDGCVGKLARWVYDDGAFDRLPLLADALEDAGCDDQEILNHCREPGDHGRGCWVVDLLLGKT